MAIKIRALEYDYGNEIHLFVVDLENRLYGELLTMLPMPDSGVYERPTLRIDYRNLKETFQPLVDFLWQRGVRPSGPTNIDMGIDQLRLHLADMRQIAFSKLEIQKP